MLAKNETDLPISRVTGKPLTMPLCNRSFEDLRDELAKGDKGQDTMRWHVGFSVNESMERSLETLRQVYGKERVYYPMVREMRPVPKRELTESQRNSPFAKLKLVLMPLFPRYFFTQFSLMDEVWHDLFELAHIRGLVCNNDGGRPMPAPIEDTIVAGLRGMEIEGGIPSAATIKQLAYSLGEEVRIMAGALEGHNGTVDRLPDVPIEQLDESARLRLLVTLFGRKSVIELAITDIEKL